MGDKSSTTRLERSSVARLMKQRTLPLRPERERGQTFGVQPCHSHLMEAAADKTLQWLWLLGDLPANEAQ